MGITYKIEYPFAAIDATLFHAIDRVGDATGATQKERTPLTAGSVLYRLTYPEFKITLSLHALDTRLCVLRVAADPDDGTVSDAQLRRVLDDIANLHEQMVADVEVAETLFAIDRQRGGRETWPEDAEAIARLQAGADRAMVKREWLKHVARNRKRKKIADPDNRFRQLVQKANRS